MSTLPRELGFTESCPLIGKARIFHGKDSFPCYPGPSKAWSFFKKASRSSRARLYEVVQRGGEEEADLIMRRLLWP